MKIDEQKFSEFFRIAELSLNAEWVKQIYSLIESYIDADEFNLLEAKLKSDVVENSNKLKHAVFKLALDIVSKQKSTYFEFKFDTSKKSIKSFKPHIIPKERSIRLLIEQILSPYKNIKSDVQFVLEKLKESQVENKDLKFYVDDMNRRAEKLQTAYKSERDKRLKLEKYKNCPEENELYKFANDCRKKNGKINYSKLGKKLGRSHVTAKSWCDSRGIA